MVAIQVPTPLVDRHLVKTSTDTAVVEARWCEQGDHMQRHEYPSQSLYRITHQPRSRVVLFGSTKIEEGRNDEAPQSSIDEMRHTGVLLDA